MIGNPNFSLMYFSVSRCKVETGGGDSLDDTRFQASINNNAVPGLLYQVDQFYNGIGKIMILIILPFMHL